MSEHSLPQQKRMVNVLRPEIRLSSELENIILEGLRPVSGKIEHLGAFVTKTIVVDADLYQSGIYDENIRRYEDEISLEKIRLGTQPLPDRQLPSSVGFKQGRTDKHEIVVALRPRSTAHLARALRYLDFNTPHLSETAQPYEVIDVPNGNNYVLAHFAGAELAYSPNSGGYQNYLHYFNNSVTPTQFQEPYFMTGLPLNVSGQQLRSVSIRPSDAPGEVA